MVSSYRDIFFKYQYLYRWKKNRGSPMHWCIVIVYRCSPIAEINNYCRVAVYPRLSTHPVSLIIKEGMNFLRSERLK